MPLVAQQKNVTIELDYDPNPKQRVFHAMGEKYRFFVGGWGNGKTDAGVAEAFALAMEYPGTTGLIARKTRPELRATTQRQFFEGGRGPKGCWPGCPQEVIRKFNKTDNELTLINDTKIHFWPLDDPDKLSNINLSWFLIDQGEEVPEEMFQMLQGRLREASGPRLGMVLANPNGHDWIWRRNVFLKGGGAYRDHGMVHATTYDNPNLPADYIESLQNMPEAWVKRFVEGSFDVFSGQIWPEFDPDVHVIRPFPIPDYWDIYEGIDHGRRNPTSVLWAAFDERNNGFIFDEHYEAGRLVGYHAKAVLEKRTFYHNPVLSVIDASAAAKDPNTGRSVVDEYWDHGIVTVPSDRHVQARINRIAEWLMLDKNHPHPVTGELSEDGWPKLYIFANCVNLIEHTQQYQWKKQPIMREEDAPEKPLEKDDHDVDAMGYILMTRPHPAAPFAYGEDPDSPAAWYWKRVRERMDRNEGSGNRHSYLGSEA